MQDHPNCEHCGGKLRHGKRWCSRECYDIARILSISRDTIGWKGLRPSAGHSFKTGNQDEPTTPRDPRR